MRLWTSMVLIIYISQQCTVTKKDLRTAWSFFHAYFYTYFQLIILSLLFSAARPRDCMRCAVPDFLIFFSILF